MTSLEFTICVSFTLDWVSSVKSQELWVFANYGTSKF